jgi:poly(A) polymerase
MANGIPAEWIASVLPPWLWHHLRALYQQLGGEIYLAGGTVRDLLLGNAPQDIDLTVDRHARQWARGLAMRSGGAYVPLGRTEDAARVVAHALTVDFSAFRQGAQTVADDLRFRDLTVNALAVQLERLLNRELATGSGNLPLLDPTGGLKDLEQGLIRMAGPGSFRDDPLRLLRAFRFSASLGFEVEPQTLAHIRREYGLVTQPAPERVAHELDLIMASGNSYRAIRSMEATGLLGELIPELVVGRGMAQPKSHHLDVFEHSLEALRHMESLLIDPGRWFLDSGDQLRDFIRQPGQHRRLCWAALMHDLGKPPTFARRPDREGRITFYHHEHVGARLLEAFALRLRWRNEDREMVAQLIRFHMRPFFLANVAREGKLTLRACIRLLRKAGVVLPGLFLLAMADSLAGQGEERIVGMEDELSDLFLHLQQVLREHVTPVRAARPLINGTDLITELGLTPGPLFKTILGAVEEAQMEGRVMEQSEALDIARRIAAQAVRSTGS